MLVSAQGCTCNTTACVVPSCPWIGKVGTTLHPVPFLHFDLTKAFALLSPVRSAPGLWWSPFAGVSSLLSLRCPLPLPLYRGVPSALSTLCGLAAVGFGWWFTLSSAASLPDDNVVYRIAFGSGQVGYGVVVATVAKHGTKGFGPCAGIRPSTMSSAVGDASPAFTAFCDPTSFASGAPASDAGYPSSSPPPPFQERN